mgnify:CR=1 FL=1
MIVDTADKNITRGINKFSWNGRDSDGLEVPTGMYFILIKQNDITFNKKIILMK